MDYGIHEVAELAQIKEDTLRHLVLRKKIQQPERTLTGGYRYDKTGLKAVLKQIDKIKVKNRNFYIAYQGDK